MNIKKSTCYVLYHINVHDLYLIDRSIPAILIGTQNKVALYIRFRILYYIVCANSNVLHILYFVICLRKNRVKIRVTDI